MGMVGGFDMMAAMRVFRPNMAAGVMAVMAMRMRDMPARRGGGRPPGDRRAILRIDFVLRLDRNAMRMGDRAEGRKTLIIGVGRIDFFAIVYRARRGVREGRRRDQRGGKIIIETYRKTSSS